MNLKFSLLTAFCCLSLFTACEKPVAEMAQEVVRANSGGDYFLISWHHMEAEILHPSATPGENYHLCLPLPASPESYNTKVPLGTLLIENGGFSFTPYRADGRLPEHTYYYVVQDGKAVNNNHPKLEFRTALARFGNEWKLVISKKQYSMRQLGKDLAEFGATEAVEIPMTQRIGWYRYAEAPFELRRGKAVAQDLFTLKAKEPA